MSLSRVLVLFAALLFSQSGALASEAPLDAPYRHLVHPRIDRSGRDSLNPLPTKSDTLAVIANQSAIKNQAARGSCSIFSAIALLESSLILEGKAAREIDLSEEWLQYLIAQGTTDEGSSSPANFDALHEYGAPSENKMPYIGASWKNLSDGEAQTRCGALEGVLLKKCLVGHRDPRLLSMSEAELSSSSGDAGFLEARREASQNKKRFFSPKGSEESGIVFGTREVKELLQRGIPLALDIDFYYGAWNHRLATDMGINRDTNNWAKGVVSYPEKGSMDLAHSNEHSAGHSVVVVGYDDEREIEYQVKMKNGRTKKFKRKGVYYFKNSWGTTNFGTTTEIEGKVFPGYGIISQDYAEEYGQFFKLVL